MVCGVELDADAEGGGDDFAGLGEDVEDELGSLLGGAAVSVGAEIRLSWLGRAFIAESEKQVYLWIQELVCYSQLQCLRNGRTAEQNIPIR